MPSGPFQTHSQRPVPWVLRCRQGLDPCHLLLATGDRCRSFLGKGGICSRATGLVRKLRNMSMTHRCGRTARKVLPEDRIRCYALISISKIAA